MQFFPALAIVLITLKLLGLITTSWLWVLSPLWLPFVLIFVGAFIVEVISRG